MFNIFDDLIITAQKKYAPEHQINKAGLKRINISLNE